MTIFFNTMTTLSDIFSAIPVLISMLPHEQIKDTILYFSLFNHLSFFLIIFCDAVFSPSAEAWRGVFAIATCHVLSFVLACWLAALYLLSYELRALVCGVKAAVCREYKLVREGLMAMVELRDSQVEELARESLMEAFKKNC